MEAEFRRAPQGGHHKTHFTLSGIRKASVVVRDVVDMYLPFYGIDPSNCWSKLDILFTTEALIYAMDDSAESGTMPVDYVTPFLDEQQLAIPHWDKLLGQGARFYSYEIRLRRGGTLSEAEIMDALRCRSTDYQILHRLGCIVCQTTVSPVIEQTMSIIDAMREIEYDLAHYARDVEANTYNMYRAMIRLYGAREAATRLQTMLNAIHAEAELTASTNADFARALSLHRRRYAPTPVVPFPDDRP